MPKPQLSMPVAVPPPGTDSTNFYATFIGKLTASYSPNTGLIVWVAADDDIARLHAPIKSAMRFVPAGNALDGTPVTANTLVLHTWPIDYLEAYNALNLQVPSQIRMENVDAAAVRTAVKPLYTAINRSDEDVDAFMAGNGEVKVAAGMAIGAAAPKANAPSTATPNSTTIRLFRGSVHELNPTELFLAIAQQLGIDKTLHPLLSQLDLEGWIDVIAFDASGTPLTQQQYTVYLSDGTTRPGTTDANGRIYETGIPSGSWGLDLKNLPSFRFLALDEE